MYKAFFLVVFSLACTASAEDTPPIYSIYKAYKDNTDGYGKITNGHISNYAISQTFKIFLDYAKKPKDSTYKFRDATQAEWEQGRMAFLAQALYMQAKIASKFNRYEALERLFFFIKTPIEFLYYEWHGQKKTKEELKKQNHLRVVAMIIEKGFGKKSLKQHCPKLIAKTIKKLVKLKKKDRWQLPLYQQTVTSLLNDKKAKESYKQLGVFYEEYQRLDKEQAARQDTPGTMYQKLCKKITGVSKEIWGKNVKPSTQSSIEEQMMKMLAGDTRTAQAFALRSYVANLAYGVILPKNIVYNAQTVADLKHLIAAVDELDRADNIYLSETITTPVSLVFFKGDINDRVLDSMVKQSRELKKLISNFFIHFSHKEKTQQRKFNNLIDKKLEMGQVVVETPNLFNSLGDFLKYLIKQHERKYFTNLSYVAYLIKSSAKLNKAAKPISIVGVLNQEGHRSGLKN